MITRTLAIMLTFILAAVTAVAAGETALDRYIAKPDPTYAWKLISEIPGEGCTSFVLELTSQTWRSEREVDRPVWTHWLTITRPDNPRPGTAALSIGGGDNGDPAPQEPSRNALRLAIESRTVVAELGQVPNQPLFFRDSRKEDRQEDDLIAYSRVKYIVTGDEEWLVRLPMVKSAVRAMDAVQEFMNSDQGGGIAIEKFLVSGGSKRAWTTWLTAIEDPRVCAIVPFVIDALNTEAITRHHYEAYGFFSTALADYVNHGLYPGILGTPVFNKILEIEDPYMYRDRERLKIPKYIINASGDQFFLMDNSQFYFKDLPEEKYLRYVPNARHNLAGSDARESLIAFYQSILAGAKRPTYSWTLEKNGPIRVKTPDTPLEVNLWQASNPEARDFRLDKIGPAWKSTPLTPDEAGGYTAAVPRPEKGYTAFFVELVFDSGFDYPFKFTTDVNVVPDILPYKLEKHTVIELK